MVGEGRGGVKKRGAKKLDRGGQYADINHVQCSDLKHLRAVWGLAAVDDPTLRALEGEEEEEEGEGEEGEGEEGEGEVEEGEGEEGERRGRRGRGRGRGRRGRGRGRGRSIRHVYTVCAIAAYPVHCTLYYTCFNER